jgi:hypothetical protein
LGDNIGIIAAGNDIIDSDLSNEISRPFANRFTHVQLEPDYMEWIQWAMSKGLDERCIAFIGFKPSALIDIPKRGVGNNKAFPTPRTWEKCAAKIKNITDPIMLYRKASMTLGNATATEFKEFVEVALSYNLEDIINNPQQIKNIYKMDILYSIAGGLIGEYIRTEDINKTVKIINAITYMQPEQECFAIQLIKQNNNTVEKQQK